MPSRTLPAPTGGWNVKDALSDLRENEAPRLDNWFPDYGRVSVRPGYSAFVTSGMGTAKVETLFEFNADGSRYFGACTDGGIFEITSGTPVSLRAASTYNDSRWQWATMENSAGSPRVGLVSEGADAPQIVTDGGSAMSIADMTISGSGLTPSDLSGINVFKSRSYFWTGSDQDFWYSATNAMGGTLTKFPLGRVNNTGGDLIAMSSWSVDGGDGKDDLAVFFLSSGDVLVYAGDDPGSSWSLQGVYNMGPLIDKRALMRLRGDVIAVTKDGYLPISKNLPLARVAAQSISENINPEVVERARFGADFAGWQMVHYPRRNMVIVNVPLTSGIPPSPAQYQQHVFNTQTAAACRFTGIPSACWSLFRDDLYFGGLDGKVYKFDGALSDDGAGIIADAETAWSYMRSPSRRKLFTAVRPNFIANGDLVGHALAMGVDFQDAPAVAVPASGTGVGTPWGSAWGSAWSGDSKSQFAAWRSVKGSGFSGSMRLRVANSSQSIDWLATNVLYEIGGEI